MNTQPTDWLLAAFGVWQAVEVCHHGEIFAALRARLELGFDDGLPEPLEGRSGLSGGPGRFLTHVLARTADEIRYRAAKVGNFAAHVFLCPVCLSVWVGGLAGVLTGLGGWWNLPFFALALSRLANLANDLAYRVNRNFNRKKLNVRPDDIAGSPQPD